MFELMKEEIADAVNTMVQLLAAISLLPLLLILCVVCVQLVNFFTIYILGEM